MKIEHIKAVVDATVETLEAMECKDVRLGKVSVVSEPLRTADMSSVTVGVKGGLEGVLILAFVATESAMLASNVAQMAVSPEDEDDICEGMAELANMIAGNIANQLYGLGVKIDITPPTITTAPHLELDFLKGSQTVLTPVVSSQGRFDLLVTVAQDRTEH